MSWVRRNPWTTSYIGCFLALEIALVIARW